MKKKLFSLIDSQVFFIDSILCEQCKDKDYSLKELKKLIRSTNKKLKKYNTVRFGHSTIYYESSLSKQKVHEYFQKYLFEILNKSPELLNTFMQYTIALFTYIAKKKGVFILKDVFKETAPLRSQLKLHSYEEFCRVAVALEKLEYFSLYSLKKETFLVKDPVINDKLKSIDKGKEITKKILLYSSFLELKIEGELYRTIESEIDQYENLFQEDLVFTI